MVKKYHDAESSCVSSPRFIASQTQLISISASQPPPCTDQSSTRLRSRLNKASTAIGEQPGSIRTFSVQAQFEHSAAGPRRWETLETLDQVRRLGYADTWKGKERASKTAGGASMAWLYKGWVVPAALWNDYCISVRALNFFRIHGGRRSFCRRGLNTVKRVEVRMLQTIQSLQWSP